MIPNFRALVSNSDVFYLFACSHRASILNCRMALPTNKQSNKQCNGLRIDKLIPSFSKHWKTHVFLIFSSFSVSFYFGILYFDWLGTNGSIPRDLARRVPLVYTLSYLEVLLHSFPLIAIETHLVK